MIVVYIAHPIRGDVEANLESLNKIIWKVNMNMKNVIPFVPYYADVMALDDNKALERIKGMRNSRELFKRGFIDQLWLCGPKMSEGMRKELELARSLGIPVMNRINGI